MSDTLRGFLDAADVSTWAGLSEAGTSPWAYGADPAESRLMRGYRGEPPALARWVPAPTSRFASGVQLWLDDDGRVVVVQGIEPVADDGTPLPAPDLGEPEALLDAGLGGLVLAEGERVFAARGIAVRANPDDGTLLELIGFGPTSVADYRMRLRPALEVDEPLHPLPRGGRA